MKTYEQLTETEKTAAVDAATNSLLRAICEGAIRFCDELNGDGLQARIDTANAQAEAMQTPWFSSEYVMESCGKEIQGMAQCNAEDALYSEPDECVVSGIVNAEAIKV